MERADITANESNLIENIKKIIFSSRNNIVHSVSERSLCL